MNRLLTRIIKKYLGPLYNQEKLFHTEPFQIFLNAIDRAFDFKDKETVLLERTIDMSSKELNEANKLLKEQNEKILKLAMLDPLTGLPNRYGFNSSLDQALQLAKRYDRQFSIIFIDIDRFKVINDSLGHHVGDLLLKEVAKRLKLCIRKSDTVARLGGDEFTLLVEEIYTPDAVAQIAQKLLEELSVPCELEGHELMITVSIGISTYPSDGANLIDLFKNADTAMYQAKDHGRNNFQLFAPSMGEKAIEHMALESRLHKALDKKEFILMYQPQLDLKTGKIFEVEALIRWDSPALGLMSPADFIPLAEETGLIIPIGEWVLTAACIQCRKWQLAGMKNMRIAVNVSRLQLQNPRFIETVASALETADLLPESLELELTESAVMQRPSFTLNLLKKIKAMGVHLSIDDFGTGYSSLGNLKQFTLNKLKIDQSFVRDLENDPDAKAIIEAIIAMSHSLNLKVIAEGVETQAQLQFLKEKNCDQIQGYWLSEPKPGEDFELMLEKLHKRVEEQILF